jgi:hypothetical protein
MIHSLWLNRQVNYNTAITYTINKPKTPALKFQYGRKLKCKEGPYMILFKRHHSLT